MVGLGHQTLTAIGFALPSPIFFHSFFGASGYGTKTLYNQNSDGFLTEPHTEIVMLF